MGCTTILPSLRYGIKPYCIEPHTACNPYQQGMCPSIRGHYIQIGVSDPDPNPKRGPAPLSSVPGVALPSLDG
jgi:hypothetical protein